MRCCLGFTLNAGVKVPLGSIVFPSKEEKSANIKTIIHYPLEALASVDQGLSQAHSPSSERYFLCQCDNGEW